MNQFSKMDNILFIAVPIIVAVWFIQHYFYLKPDQLATRWIGWLMVGFVLIGAIAGLLASLLPVNRNDLSWLTTSQTELVRQVCSLFIVKVVPFFSVWIGAAALFELFLFVRGDWQPIVFKAIVSFIALLFPSWLAFCCSTIRSDAMKKRLALGVANLLGFGYLVLTIMLITDDGTSLFISLLDQLGAFVYGRITLVAVLLFLLAVGVSISFIIYFIKKPTFITFIYSETESLARNKQKPMRLGLNKSMVSNRYPFVWLECKRIKAKRAGVVFIISLPVIVLLIVKAPSYYEGLFVFASLLYLIAGYRSRVIQHHCYHTLILFPGRLLTKVIQIEVLSILSVVGGVVLFHCLGLLLSIQVTGSRIVLLYLLLALAIVIRLYTLIRMSKHHQLLGLNYLKWISAWCLLIFFTSFLFRFFPSSQLTNLIYAYGSLGILLVFGIHMILLMNRVKAEL